MSQKDQSHQVQIIVAIVGLIGVVSSALIARVIPTPSPTPSPTIPSTPSPPPSQSPVNFSISDDLGTDIGQVSEQVTVWIDGKMVGTLTVNQDFPQSILRVTVPSSGHHTYTASARATFKDGIVRTCAGQGTIDVSNGKNFKLLANIGGNNCSVLLAEE
ncbi:MAG: hypothetical protein U7127_03590 [Phormidium sp.]